MTVKTDEFIVKLANTLTEETLFNPYNQICKNYDISTAPGLRQGNLRIYLDKYLNARTDTLWVFDTADYYSTKLSGVPLLEPASFDKVEGILGLPMHFEIANKHNPVKGTNQKLSDIWELFSKQQAHPLIWNVLPFYPHETKDISVKREPSKAEYLAHADFMHTIIDIYKPKKIFAGDHKAKNALKMINIDSVIHKDL